MVICNGPNSNICRSACCYNTRKRVYEFEVDRIGREFVDPIPRSKEFAIKSKEDSRACTFLDEQTHLCDLAEDMPIRCWNFTCGGIRGYGQYLRYEFLPQLEKENNQ
jgi:Fe-S-cluster containining protein